MAYTFSEIDVGEFEGFVEGAMGRNFLQSGEMYRRYVGKGREAYLLGLKRDGEVVMAGLLVATRRYGRWSVFNCPGGFVGEYEKEVVRVMTEGCRRFLRGKRGMILQISPNMVAEERDIDAKVVEGGENNLATREMLRGMGYKYLGEYEQAKWVYKLRVKDADLEKMYKDFRKGHKLSIRYARDRYGVKVRELKYDELGVLTKLTAEAGEYHGFRAPDVSYFQEMYKAFPGKVKFLVSEMVEPEGEKGSDEEGKGAGETTEGKKGEAVKKMEAGKTVVTAGAMFVIYGDEVVYLYSGSRRQYKKYGGPHLMQWQMIQYAAEHGFNEYNFYGVRPVKGNGVYAFKRGFKGRVVELLGTFILPLNIVGRLYSLTRSTEEMRGVT